MQFNINSGVIGKQKRNVYLQDTREIPYVRETGEFSIHYKVKLLS